MSNTTNPQEIPIRCPQCKKLGSLDPGSPSGHAIVQCRRLLCSPRDKHQNPGCDAIFAVGWKPRVKVYTLVENADNHNPKEATK